MSRFIKKIAFSPRRSIFAAIGAVAVALAAGTPALADDAADFETLRQAELKVAAIGWRMAIANTALCDQISAGTGLLVHTLDQYDAEARFAAQKHFGFATPVAVEAVVAGSPADRAGVKADDALVRVGSVIIADLGGKPGATDRMITAEAAISALPLDRPIEIEALRGGQTVRFSLQPVPVCKSRFEVRFAMDWNSSADGKMVQIGSRFVDEYPEDLLAAVMAHEFSHNIMRHQTRLIARGVDFGLLAGLGGNVKYFRQAEIEADLLSVYLLANANYSPRAAIAFWKKFGPSKASSIFADRTHPSWRDTVATLEAEIAKIEPASARPIVPAILQARDRPIDGNWQALLIHHR